MSFFQDGQLVFNAREQQDADLACDELDSILSSKEGLFAELVTLKARHPEMDFSDYIAEVEEGFDDKLHKKWCENLETSGSATHSRNIPTFAELAAKREIKW